MAALGLWQDCDTVLVALSGPTAGPHCLGARQGLWGSVWLWGTSCAGHVGVTVQAVPAAVLCSCPPLTSAAARHHTDRWRIAALAKETR